MCWGRIVAKKDDLQVIDCAVCGHAHLNPIPEERKLREYYDNDRFYAEHSPSDWLLKEAREFNAGYWNPGYDYQLDLLPSLPILDVGSGIGAFLKRAYDKGWFGIGVEPSASARKVISCQNLFRDIEGAEFIYKISEIKMNVRMALVLEHIPEPVEFVQQYAKYLRASGKMIVIVPNEFSPLQKRIKGNHFVSNVHINYFNPEGLRRVMRDAGLSVVHESATFPMELFVLAGIDYRNNDALGRKVHMARLRFEKSVGKKAFRLYEYLYKKYGWGRELIFVGSKQ